eukprot:6194130-Pleurochrysis_carterae.AAC.2
MGESREAAGEPHGAAGEPGRDISNTLEMNERILSEFSPPPAAAGKLRAFCASIVQFCGIGVLLTYESTSRMRYCQRMMLIKDVRR